MKQKAFIFFLIIPLISFSQKAHKKFNASEIDTIYFFPPIGFVGVPGKDQMVPSDSLTRTYNIRMKESIEHWVVPKSIFLTDVLQDSVQCYLIDLMYRLNKLSEGVFYKNKISDNIRNIISNREGRFFAIVCYSAFQKTNYTTEMLTGLAIYTATMLISGGTFWLWIMPTDPFMNTYICIIDKKEECVQYFHSSTLERNPDKESNIEKQYKYVLSPFLIKQ